MCENCNPLCPKFHHHIILHVCEQINLDWIGLDPQAATVFHLKILIPSVRRSARETYAL